MTELQVGRLRVTIPDGGPRCGIHGLSTATGRCAGCDSAPANRPVCEAADDAFLPAHDRRGGCSEHCPVHGREARPQGDQLCP